MSPARLSVRPSAGSTGISPSRVPTKVVGLETGAASVAVSSPLWCMDLTRKPAALLIATLVVVAVSAGSQLLFDEIDLAPGSIGVSHRGVFLGVLVLFTSAAAAFIAFRARATAGQPVARMGLETAPPNEIDEFAREINRRVLEKNEAHIAALEQIRHTDRLTTVGHLAAGIAHELGTPLNVVSGQAELIITGDLDRSDIVRSARMIIDQSDRMAGIIRQLLDFSRRGVGRRADLDLRQVVTETVELLSLIATKAKVEIVCEAGAEPIPAYVDKNTMQQALTNIALNAIQAMPNGGHLRFRLESKLLQPPAGVSDAPAMYQCIMIEDDGVGISPTNLPQLFEPFFTTKRMGEGTGLGLPVAYGIVAEHGGWIAVDSAEGSGSTFSIMLPRPSAAGRREEAA